MLKNITKNIIFFCLYVLILYSVTFFLLFYGPGNPIEIILGQHFDKKTLENIENFYKLNEPLGIQYIHYLEKTINLDFGKSIIYKEKAIDLISSRIPITLKLAFMSILLALLIGGSIGTLLGFSKINNQTLEKIIFMISSTLLSIPGFWVSIIVLYAILSFTKIEIGENYNSLYNLLIPSLIISLRPIGIIAELFYRKIKLEQDKIYFIAVKSKGLPYKKEIIHILKNIIPEINSFIGIELSYLVLGAFITESIFAIPGIGTLIVPALMNRDIPLILAIVILSGLLIIGINTLINIINSLIRPIPKN